MLSSFLSVGLGWAILASPEYVDDSYIVSNSLGMHVKFGFQRNELRRFNQI